MIGYFREKNRAGTIRRIFRKYVNSYREYLKTAEQRSFELAPERKRAWQNVFRLQHLLNDCQALRFEYLSQRAKMDWDALRSLSSISDRLEKEWKKEEEEALLEINSTYKNFVEEIADIQSKWNPNALGSSSRVVDQDQIYCDARQALAERTQKLEAQLAE
jgi:hypothetical protein